MLICAHSTGVLRETVHRLSEVSLSFEERLYLAVPQSETTAGLRLFIGKKFGLIPTAYLTKSQGFKSPILVKFLGYGEDQTPLFEGVDDTAFHPSQAVNAPSKARG